MPDDRLLSIGAFALQTGLSVTALRHYHEAGLLEPVEVDPANGYRRYASKQIATARIIRTLRTIDLPIEEIAVLLASDGKDEVRVVLGRHRERLSRRGADLERMAHTTDDLIEKGALVSDMTGTRVLEVTLRVADMPGALAFYRRAFGVDFQQESHGDGPTHYHACGGAWNPEGFFLFTLWPAEAGDTTRSSIGLVVEDVDAVTKRAVEAGATLVSAPADGIDMPRNSLLDDPAGNRVTLYQAW